MNTKHNRGKGLPGVPSNVSDVCGLAVAAFLFDYVIMLYPVSREHA